MRVRVRIRVRLSVRVRVMVRTRVRVKVRVGVRVRDIFFLDLAFPTTFLGKSAGFLACHMQLRSMPPLPPPSSSSLSSVLFSTIP